MRVTGLLPASGALGRARFGVWHVDGAEAAEAAAGQASWAPWADDHPLPEGDHTVLLIDGAFSMADAPFVLRNYGPFLESAHGDVLLTGLGLGCLVRGLLTRPAVRSVTVLELLPEVIALIGPHHRDPRVDLIQADALEWRPRPGRRFDSAMLDLDDDPGTIARLVDHHRAHVHALWPDPGEVADMPPAPALERLLARAVAAVA